MAETKPVKPMKLHRQNETAEKTETSKIISKKINEKVKKSTALISVMLLWQADLAPTIDPHVRHRDKVKKVDILHGVTAE